MAQQDDEGPTTSEMRVEALLADEEFVRETKAALMALVAVFGRDAVNEMMLKEKARLDEKRRRNQV